MKFQNLNPNPKNPRKVSDEKLSQLEKALKEFGSLDGFVFNKKTGNLISGHQRRKIFKDAKIIGDFVHWNGERFPYREVNWSKNKERLATIAANQHAGEWDMPELTHWMQELSSDFAMDMSLTMFDDEELKEFQTEEEKRTGAGGADEDAVPTEVECNVKRGDLYSLGEYHECPECGHHEM